MRAIGRALAVLAAAVLVTAAAGWAASDAGPAQVQAEPVVAVDGFERLVSAGWGSAEVGGGWAVVTGGDGPFSVSAGAGSVVSPSGIRRVVHLPGVAVRDVDARVEVSFSAAGSGRQFGYLLVRRQSAGAYLRIGLMASGGKLLVRSQDSAGASVFADTDTGLGFSAGAPYVLRVQAEGAGPTTVRFKVWREGAPEPAAWLSSGATGLGPQVAGTLGVRTETVRPSVCEVEAGWVSRGVGLRSGSSGRGGRLSSGRGSSRRFGRGGSRGR